MVPFRGYLGSITSRCSGKEPAFLPRGGTQTRNDRAAEIEPRGYSLPDIQQSAISLSSLGVTLFQTFSSLRLVWMQHKKMMQNKGEERRRVSLCFFYSIPMVIRLQLATPLCCRVWPHSDSGLLSLFMHTWAWGMLAREIRKVPTVVSLYCVTVMRTMSRSSREYRRLGPCSLNEPGQLGLLRSPHVC